MSDSDISRIENAIKRLELVVEGRLTGVEKDIDYLKEEVSQLRLSLKDNHVRREEFEPIKKIVYGVVSVLMMGVVGALLAIVIK